MTSIGVIDDNDTDRNSVVEYLNLTIDNEAWEVVQSRPFSDINETLAWIGQNKVCAIIIDERLDERIHDGEAVGYRGNDLVEFIRNRFKTFPIFVITTYSGDEAIQEKFGEVEDIIQRVEFSKKFSDYTPRILRSAQKFLDVFQEELSLLASYARKVATGEDVSEEEIEKVRAIQAKLDSAYSIDQAVALSNWLEMADQTLQNIELITQEIEARLPGD